VAFPTFPALDEPPRVLRRLISQERARANASAAADALRELRRQREDADAFLARHARRDHVVAQTSMRGSTR
jgi:hypothetical protein